MKLAEEDKMESGLEVERMKNTELSTRLAELKAVS